MRCYLKSQGKKEKVSRLTKPKWVNLIRLTGCLFKELRLISDNGSQPTSRAFMREMVNLGIEQIFTSYDNPKGNADTGRLPVGGHLP